MIIRTSQDAELVNCGCCPMPTCPAPRMICQSIDGETDITYAVAVGSGNFGNYNFYQKYIWHYSGGGFTSSEFSNDHKAWFSGTNGNFIVTDSVVIDQEQPPLTGSIEIEHLMLIDVSAALDAGLSELAGAVDWDNESIQKGESCRAEMINYYTPEWNFINHNAIITLVRYRMGVPEDYSTQDAPRSTFEVSWDEVQVTPEWEAWKVLKDQYDEAKRIHDEWKECEENYPGTCGGEPFVPENPGPPPNTPILINSRNWIWGGSMNGEEQYSEWFDMPIPTTSKSITKVANILVTCYKSSRIGVKPTAHGEVIEVE